MATVTIPKGMRPFVCYVNGKKYCYPAGETLDVPEEVAEIINSMRYDNSSLPEQENKTPFEVPDAPPSGGVTNWDDLEGRPFGKETVDIPLVENQTGNGEFNEHETGNYIRVSYYGLPNEVALEIGKTYKLVVNDNEYTAICEGENKLGDWIPDADGYLDWDYSFSRYGFIVYATTIRLSTTVDYQMSVYLPADKYEAGEYTVSLYEVTTITTPIPDEYLPERLQFGESVEKVVIFENDSLLGGPALRPDNTNLSVSEMVAGDTYIVTVDGVDYTGVAEWCEDTSSEGNNGIQLFSKGEYPTDYSDAPIDIGSYSNHIYVSFEDGDDVRHSVKITHVAAVTTPLDPKYIPDTIARVEDIPTVDASYDLDVTINCLWDEDTDSLYWATGEIRAANYASMLTKLQNNKAPNTNIILSNLSAGYLEDFGVAHNKTVVYNDDDTISIWVDFRGIPNGTPSLSVVHITISADNEVSASLINTNAV